MSRHHSEKNNTLNGNTNSTSLPLDNILKNVDISELLKNVDIKQLMSIVSNLKSKKEDKTAKEDRTVVEEKVSVVKNRKEKLLELLDDDDFKNATLSIISKYRSVNKSDLDMNIFDDKDLRSSIYTVLEKILSI